MMVNAWPSAAPSLVVSPRNLQLSQDNPFDSLSRHLFEKSAPVFEQLSDESLVQSWNTLIADILDPTSSFWVNRVSTEQTALDFGLHPRSLLAALDVSLRGMLLQQVPTRDTGTTRRRASPPALVVLAANVPALVPQVLLPALLAGRPLVFKLPQASVRFHRAVLEHLIALAPSLQDVLVAACWDSTESSGTTERLLEAARPAFDPVLVYGGQAAVAAYQSLFARRTVYAFGPKFSVALVLDDDQQEPHWPQQVAKDIALFEQQGCLSVASVLLVQTSSEIIRRRASQLAEALEQLTTDLPLPASPRNAVAARHWLDSQVLAGRTVAGDLITGGAVIVAETLQPSPGARTVTIVPCTSFETALATIKELQSDSQSLQGLSLAGASPAAAAAIGLQLKASGIERIAPAGSLQETDLNWRNGGVDLIEALRPQPQI